MSYVSLVDENIEKIPNLELAHQKLQATLPEYQGDGELKNKLLQTIMEANMAPWYEIICQEMGWDYDKQLLDKMKDNNRIVLKSIDEEIRIAGIHSSTTEVKDLFLSKANYLIKIGDKENAIKTLGLAYSLTVALGYKLDNVFTCIRVGFFFVDHDIIRKNLDRAEELVLMGVDYDRRNRLTVYQGFYALFLRDFKTASSNFLKTVSTFNCYELIDYTRFIRYTIITAAYVLSRQDLKSKVIENSDILEALYRTPDIKKFVFSLYRCHYADYFEKLADIEQIFRKDYVLYPHYRYYVREMKLKAYVQFLRSYKTVSFAYVAEQFGVTTEFVEKEIGQLIAAGKLYAKIDKVKNSIIVSHTAMEKRNELFNDIIRQGDVLLNRIHELARFVDSYS